MTVTRQGQPRALRLKSRKALAWRSCGTARGREINRIARILHRIRQAGPCQIADIFLPRKGCSAMTVRHIPGRITALVSRLRRDREANVAVMFAIAAIPVLGMVGAATDYSLATR